MRIYETEEEATERQAVKPSEDDLDRWEDQRNSLAYLDSFERQGRIRRAVEGRDKARKAKARLARAERFRKH